MPESDSQNLLFSSQPTLPDWEPTEAEIDAVLELNTINSFRTQFRRLRTHFRDFTSILKATSVDLEQFSGWPESRRSSFLEQVGTLEVGREAGRIPCGVDILTYFDKRYPASLREIYDPPPVLYVRGSLEYDYAHSISIVGTRLATDYGRRVAERFSYCLASWGFTVISGGASGIDTISHRSALASGGRTIAVLGCGIDIMYPDSNKALFEQISRQGAIVCEFPPGTIPEKYNFPARNRIIAALGRGTLVIEAPEKSGALITAELALQNGREVFAVPGRITDGRSYGTNLLIRDGAQIALDPESIPARFGFTLIEADSSDQADPGSDLTGDEALVYKEIGLDPIESDELVREIGLPASRVLSAILILQTRGLVKELPGSRFVRPVMRVQRNPGPVT